jgi:hypothetical protein
MPHNYWIDNEKIGTICLPNPRKEFTPYFISNEILKLTYIDRETIWRKAERQDFFENENRRICEWGSQYGRQFDYIEWMNKAPHKSQVESAEYFGISPQILVNTDALETLYDYCQSEFGAFHLEDFKYILKQGVWVNWQDNWDATLLTYFAEAGYANAVEIMLEYGFEINAVDMFEATALDYAIAKNRNDTVELLRNKGAKTGKEMKAK